MHYYNDNDPDVCKWLECLIKKGQLPNGHVDNRSILDVKPSDLSGYTSCHFFAGIGGWPYALRLAGIPDDLPVWTGSAPCQPFSNAGNQKGTDDERHLAPTFLKLIGECKPSIIFGEQVASKLGRDWLSDLRTEMETLGYEVGASDLCAAGIGAPHIRQRLYFGGVSNSYGIRQQGQGEVGRSSYSEENRNREVRGAINAVWSGTEWVRFKDGKTRCIKPGIFPMAHGVPARVVRLRGYGNAIVPQVAATFVKSFMEAI